ncbi:hypothetical protein ZWY2020_053023 [Hordeum vulgare]|nr:hypothetical protein ZWY2020_053023 [Hordeum vulgare]
MTRPPLSAAAKSTPASISTVGDLRGLAASSLDSLKRRLDALHADNARDLEASHSRISKRIKMHTHSCLKMAEEAEKEHKKMVDKVSLQADEMKLSYKKLVTEVEDELKHSSPALHSCNLSLEWWSFVLLVLLSGLLANPKLEASVLSICLNTTALTFMMPFGLGAAIRYDLTTQES